MNGNRGAYGIIRGSRRTLSPEELRAALSPHARRDLREREFDRAIQDGYRRARQKSQLIQSLIEGICIYLPVELFLYGLTLLSAAMTVSVGLLLGWVWHTTRPIPSVAGLTAVLGFAGIHTVCGMGSAFQAIIAMLFIICVACAISITRASERLGA